MNKHPTKNQTNTELINTKQVFLASAIADISAYIQLADTKVSIIMASIVAIAVGVFQSYNQIEKWFSSVKPCSWIGVSIVLATILLVFSFIGVFVFGLLTIGSHSSRINYRSKWFLPQSTKEYPFDKFKNDVHSMNERDIIENMAAELYKLNDINRQKQRTNKWTLLSFSMTLITGIIICILLIIAN